MSGKKCNVEVFARVTGFFRPVQSWNKGKTAEFKDRKKYELDTSKVENENSRLTESVAG
jgi:ribonucleoside-triphosphate reductase